MSEALLSEVLKATNRKDLREVGGGHMHKGVEFQRHWALLRMFEMEGEGMPDFLFLFESVQDVAYLDSETSPSAIHICQVKKKDREEWKWGALTGLQKPPEPGKRARRRAGKTGPTFSDSPLAKLYLSVFAFKDLASTGRIVSDAPFDLPLADGTNAATSLPCKVSDLAGDHLALLSEAVKEIVPKGENVGDLSRLGLERVSLPAGSPGTYLVGHVHDFLLTRSPRHAGQARALVEALLAKIAPLSAKTDHCKTFAEMRKERGFSRAELAEALGALQTVPDLEAILSDWLTQLKQEGATLLEVTSIRTAATARCRRVIMRAESAQDSAVAKACKDWIQHRTIPVRLTNFFESGHAHLQPLFPSIKRVEILATLAVTAIQTCTDPT